MKHLRYMGEFLSVSGVVWRVEILQEADAEFATVGALEFPADEPLVIEWKREDKETPILGSNATLKIISPGDRTYEDLYSIDVGRVRLDVYCNNALYWSGCLDTEFYEEPYEQLNGYEVSLTFSDFGVLDRLKYDLTGVQTLRDIVLYAMQRAGILYSGLNTDYITTQFTDGVSITGGGISVRSDNFIDEDGELLTLYEVLEGILQPLAVRIVQRAGVVYLYDLNGLHTLGTGKAIQWDGDSQTMGTDKVLNDVKVNFSPYSSAELLNSEIEFKDKYGIDKVNLTSEWPDGSEVEYYSYYPDYSEEHRKGYNWDYLLVNFTIFLSNKGSGLAYLSSDARYFHIVPAVGGPAETSGVAYFFRTGGHGDLKSGWPKKKINSSVGKGSDRVLMQTSRVYLPTLTEEEQKNYYIRVSLEMLLDARYNPFTDANEGNESGNYNAMKVYTGWAFIPVAITLYDHQDNPILHYSNRKTAETAANGHIGWNSEWVAGAASFGDAWLEYYNANDLKEDAGILGWKANRHCIGRPDNNIRLKNAEIDTFYMYDSFKKMADGEYIKYPEKGGYLEVVVYAGVRCFDYGEKMQTSDPPYGFDYTSSWDNKGLYDKIRWLLYKAPKVEVVKSNLIFENAENDDVEYSGYINKAAKESTSIDTICGTTLVLCPTAKGTYYRTSTGEQLQMLKRSNIVDHPEKLLIGTMYSQYADRKITLSGGAVIDSGLHYYTEQNQGNKRFILMSDEQNVIMDCTDAMYCEFSPDEYNNIEEVN